MNKKRIQLARAQKWCCYWCQQQCRPNQGWQNSITLEHVQPRCQGGSNEPWNLVMACHRCNHLRSDTAWEDFAIRAKWLLPDIRPIEKANLELRRQRNKRLKARRRAKLLNVRPLDRLLWVVGTWARVVPVW